MTKNVTLSANPDLIKRAREKAEKEGTTLNALFRDWLARYVNGEEAARRFDEVMESLSHIRVDRKFSRDEMNER